MTDMSLSVIVLAAGVGKRMRSSLPKPLIPLGGKPLLAHVLENAKTLRAQRTVVVAPPNNAEIRAVAKSYNAVVVEQKKPKGTADATRCAVQALPAQGSAIILCADSPLLRADTIRRLAKLQKSDLSLLVFSTTNPKGYGRIVRQGGKITAIVEEKDADTQTRTINEVYAGALAAPLKWLKKSLSTLSTNNAAKEFYLTDLAAVAAKSGMKISATQATEEEACGINTAGELATATAILRYRAADSLLSRGVRLADPQRVDVRGIITVGRDVEIDINTIFIGRISLARGCRIGANCVLIDSSIGADSVIEPFSHLHNAKIGARCRVGPYARLRPGAELKNEAFIGNFVEVKNSSIGTGAKAGHLTYLGDSTIGANANIGAGTITCNYDGKEKHRTVIGDEVFVGSGTQLVAPIKIGKGTYIAAGSTITNKTPPQSLAIARARQKILPLPRSKRKPK